MAADATEDCYSDKEKSNADTGKDSNDKKDVEKSEMEKNGFGQNDVKIPCETLNEVNSSEPISKEENKSRCRIDYYYITITIILGLALLAVLLYFTVFNVEKAQIIKETEETTESYLQSGSEAQKGDATGNKNSASGEAKTKSVAGDGTSGSGSSSAVSGQSRAVGGGIARRTIQLPSRFRSAAPSSITTQKTQAAADDSGDTVGSNQGAAGGASQPIGISKTRAALTGIARRTIQLPSGSQSTITEKTQAPAGGNAADINKGAPGAAAPATGIVNHRAQIGTANSDVKKKDGSNTDSGSSGNAEQASTASGQAGEAAQSAKRSGA